MPEETVSSCAPVGQITGLAASVVCPGPPPASRAMMVLAGCQRSYSYGGREVRSAPAHCGLSQSAIVLPEVVLRKFRLPVMPDSR